MNKKLLSILLAIGLSLVTVLATACNNTDRELNSVTLSDDDFQYTLVSEGLEYKANALSPDAPFDVTLTIEYTGDQDTINLWCTDDLGSISMEDKNGKTLISNEFRTRATSRVTLTKGEPYSITWNGSEEYSEYGGIPEGTYKVVAYINFSTDATYESIQENTLDLTLTVK